MLCAGEKIKIFFAEACAHDPENWMSGMSQEKRDRIFSLKKEQDRRLVVTAHRLLCYALYRTFGWFPSESDWARGWHGKPYLKTAPHIHYNLSHSGSVAMCAVYHMPVGADIERIRPVEEGLERLILSEEELAHFYTVQDKPGLFYQIWTLKEAYLKYNGRGIGADLSALTLYPMSGRIISNVSGCSFALIGALPGYQAAVCAADSAHCIEWVPKESLDAF